MRIVIFSATSLIAQHCARIWAASEGSELVLVGRNIEELNSVKADLQVRFPTVSIQNYEINMNSPVEIQFALNELFATPVDIALLAQGSLTDQALASSNLAYLEGQLAVNVLSLSLCLENFAEKFEEQGFGSLAVIGSVAGDRGRAYNYSYGASKAFVEKYAEGLQQRFAATRISVTLIKPGPTATPMTTKHLGRMASPERVADDIVSAIRNKRLKIYTPRSWKFIMLIVKLIPFFIFKRLSF